MSNDKDKREGWLRELKPGDKVAVDGYGLGEKGYDFDVVAKVTPTGVIKTEKYKRQFDADGRLKSGDRWHFHKLVQVTDELLAGVRRQRLVAHVRVLLDATYIDRKKVEAATDEDLRRILDVLGPYRTDKE